MVKLPDPQQDVGTTLMARLVGRVEGMLRDRRWKKSSFAHGKVSANTVRRILHGKNARLSTLIALADALDCELVVDLQPRHIEGPAPTDAQYIAHER
jgi:DNA-binding Xre family transcriptional regulator